MLPAKGSNVKTPLHESSKTILSHCFPWGTVFVSVCFLTCFVIYG